MAYTPSSIVIEKKTARRRVREPCIEPQSSDLMRPRRMSSVPTFQEESKSMRRIAFLSIILCGLAGLVLALQDPEMQQKVAAAKEAAARNQQALHEYSWISKTEILVKGEVKNTKIESNQYGPDGTVQKADALAGPTTTSK